MAGEGDHLQRIAFDEAAVGVAAVGPDGRIQRVNRALATLVAAPAESLIGTAFAHLFDDDASDRSVRLLQFLLRDGQSRRLELRLRGAGPERWARINASCVQRGDRPELIIATVEDISDRRAAEQDLQTGVERYRLVVDRANDIIFNIDLEGRFTFVNPMACRLMQYPERELVGKHFLELIRPDYRADAERFYRRQVRHRLPSTYYEFPAVARDGTVIWLGQYVQLILDGDRIGRVQALARDITARREMEEALRTSEERLRAVIANAPVILWAGGRDGVFSLCEGQGLKALGLESTTVVGRAVQEVYGYPEVDDHLHRALGGESFRTRMVLGERSFDLWYSPHRDGRGEITGVIGVAVDISESARLEERLMQAEKMEAIGRLAGGNASRSISE